MRSSKNKIKSHWNEEWAKVETSLPTKKCDYYISNYGRIKSVHKKTEEERLLNGSALKGFRRLSLRLVGGTYDVYVHKFVVKHFGDQEPNEDQTFVIHLDGNKSNNYYKNLKYVNREELTAFQTEQGMYDRENKKLGKHTKMTEAKVILLKQRIKAGKTKKKILAKSFGISTMQLNRIERGENWGHVTIE